MIGERGIPDDKGLKRGQTDDVCSLVLAWCVIHQDELMQNWELAKDGKPLNRINPLV